MRIALFPSAFYPSLGGVEELTRQLAHELVALGHEIIVITNRWPRSLPSEELLEGLPVYRIAMRIPEGGLKARASYALTHGAILNALCGRLSRHKVDLLHVQCVSSNGLYAHLAARRLGLPLVVTAQGELKMDASQLYERSAYARQTLRTCLASARAITACSRQTLAELAEFYQAPLPQPNRVIYNGIRLKDFDEASERLSGRPYALAIGRHVPQKGFDVLIRAFAESVALGNTACDLTIAGDGPENDALRQLAIDLKVEERVRFTGRTDRPQTVRLFQGCKFFVLPSRHEPFGIVNLEAMAARKAVIASAVGGVPEIVHDTLTGLLVPPEAPDELARAMLRLMDDEALSDKFGRAGRLAAEGFDWPVIAAQYLDVYRQASIN